MTRCGEFYRATKREGEGPRGGRVTFVRVECAECGTKSAEVRTKYAGSYDREIGDLVETLRGTPCPKPRETTAGDRLLLALAEWVRANGWKRPPLRLALEHCAPGETVDEGIARAWKQSRSGYAMGSLVAGMSRVGFWRSASRSADGATTSVGVTFSDGTEMTLRGRDTNVASMLRRTVTAPQFEAAPATQAVSA